MWHTTNWKDSDMYRRILPAIGAVLLLALNMAHPLFHGLEGGALDAVLAQANQLGLYLLAETGR